MEPSTIALVVIGIILAAAGVAALVYAFNVRIKTLQTNIDSQTSLALTKNQLDNELHSHALTQAELENTQTELSTIKLNIAETAGKLKAFGVIHDDTDILALEQSDIIIEGKPVMVDPTTSGLPTIPGMTPAAVRKALVHAANRTGSRANRPFSRSYMIKPGICSRSQLDKLVNVLLDAGYLEQDTQEKSSPLLTPLGQHLLDLARTGQV